ncbi:MAG: hypothetical protein Kow00117_15830 [Phototrophicales bacterium]
MTESPYSQEAEEAVIGAVLINQHSFLTVAAFLRPEDFFFLRHAHIWEAMTRLHERKEPIDPVTLAEELSTMGKLDDVGGAPYFTHLIANTPTSVHAEIYGRIVERTAIRRRLIVAADEIKALASDENQPIEHVTTSAETALFQVTDRNLKREFVTMKDAVNDYFDRIENLIQHQQESLGLPSGFRDLDQLLGGFQKSDLLIFAGRPGMGKCVTGDTIVQLPDRYATIESLKPRHALGIPDDDGGIYYPLECDVLTPQGFKPTAYFYESGLRPTLRITTQAGFTLAGTYHHPILTSDSLGQFAWKTLAELTLDDYAVVVEHGSDYTTSRITAIQDNGWQYCYDLTVPDGQAFIANHIINHNTSFMLSTAVNVARIGARVAIFTMEMGADQLVQRIMAMETGISSHKLRLGRLSPQQYDRFVEAAGRVSRYPIFIDDTPALNPIQMRTKCRRLQHEYGIDLVFVDYLQLMNAGGQYQNNRVQEISYISRALKELARELNVPVFSAAQLSRAVEQRQDKRPVLSDLRESGSIEQDADIVMFLYRDAIYNEATEFPNQADVIVAKHRNGPTGVISLFFNEELTKFQDAVTRQVDLGDR